MTQQLDDRTGAPVTVRVDETRPIGIYTANLADGSPVGRVEFVDSPEVDGERIFFHTEVDKAFTGRGIAGILVREVLADSIRRGVTVVPVCPLLARHLREHGAAFVADGGRFRQPTPADIALVTRATQGDP
jgi:predicted GNAT family acetyltransferase